LVAIETAGSWSQQSTGHKTGAGDREMHISAVTEDNRETLSVSETVVSVVLQKRNAVSFLGTYPQD